MNVINNIIVSKFKPDSNTIHCVAEDVPFNPDLTFPQKKMEKFNPGTLPPHFLHLKEDDHVHVLHRLRYFFVSFYIWNITLSIFKI